MKKIVAAFLVGALTMVSFQAFASSGFLGKKIDGETSLKINGKVVGQAIIVDGKSFAPVREVTNGVGGSVIFNKSGGAVEMTISDTSPDTTGISPIAAEEQKQLDKRSEISNIEQSILNQEKEIQKVEQEILNQENIVLEYKEKVESNKVRGIISTAETKYEIFKNHLEDLKKQLANEQGKHTDLVSQLAEMHK